MSNHPLYALVGLALAGFSLSPSSAPVASAPDFTAAEIAAAFNVIAKGAGVAVQGSDCVTAAAYVNVFKALSLQYAAPSNVRQYMANVNTACPADPDIDRIVHAKRKGTIRRRQVEMLLQMEGLSDEQLGGLELVILKQKKLFRPERANGVELQQWREMQREIARP